VVLHGYRIPVRAAGTPRGVVRGARRGAAEVVVLIHGLAGGAAVWEPVLAEWDRRGDPRQMVAPDLVPDGGGAAAPTTPWADANEVLLARSGCGGSLHAPSASGVRLHSQLARPLLAALVDRCQGQHDRPGDVGAGEGHPEFIEVAWCGPVEAGAFVLKPSRHAVAVPSALAGLHRPDVPRPTRRAPHSAPRRLGLPQHEVPVFAAEIDRPPRRS
jgi:hypothetical protein